MGLVSLIFYLVREEGMFSKTKNDFYYFVCFRCEYLRTQKLENVVFLADAVLKSGRSQCEIFLSVTGFLNLPGPMIQIKTYNFSKKARYNKRFVLLEIKTLSQLQTPIKVMFRETVWHQKTLF